VLADVYSCTHSLRKSCRNDLAIILAPMLLILLLIIVFPGIVLWLPTLLMPGFK